MMPWQSFPPRFRRAGQLGRALRKALSLRQTQESDLDEASRSLLVNLIDTYLPLSVEEEEELRRIVGQPGLEEVEQVITSFEQRGIEQGIERGIVEGKRDALRKIARSRFGEPTADLGAAIEAAATTGELDLLLERLLKAASPEEAVRPQQS
jgi:hypothetical protein